ncbi:MAG: hypothetical protein KIT57_16230 [Blastocatellales bacterium]|nr:hypothetical protein [Blastocatellales bacterium]
MRTVRAVMYSITVVSLMWGAAAGSVNNEMKESEVNFTTPDGWRISGSLFIPSGAVKAPGAVFVHASRHESDAYGNINAPGIPQTLGRADTATLRIDIRGRGASREPRVFNSLAPSEREAVRIDITAAIDFLASQPGVDAGRIGIVAEQDSADAALIAAAGDRRVKAFILISGRLGAEAKAAGAASRAAVYCMASKEDRRGFRDMTDVYLASKSKASRLRIFEGLAMGTTMFSTFRFERPAERPIDEIAAEWMIERLTTTAAVSRARKN